MRNKKCSLLLCLLLMILALAGCGSQKSEDADSRKESMVDKMERLKDQDNLADGKQENIADHRTKLSMEEIEMLAKERVFNVHWYTEEGDYSSGTASVIDSEKHGQKLLVTAFHFLWPDDADTFTGEELPEFVQGGEIFYALEGAFTGASLKNCLVIKDANAVPVVDKDVAAFTIQGGEDLKTLPLAKTMPEVGDTIYLLASLWDGDVINDNCVYPGEVKDVDGGVLYYTLDGTPKTTGASGGPVINEYGEVVAMHMASNPMCFIGHMPNSFGKMIESATISDITYPAMEPTVDEVQDDEGADMEEYICGERVSTMFYDVMVNAVSYTDSLAEVTGEEGYQFMIMDVSLWAAEDLNEPVDMYYYDFAAEWMDDYCEPLKTGLVEGQLPDEYTITKEETRGKLVFYVPKDTEILALTCIDYYYTEESEEAQYGTLYVTYLPTEDWTR